MIRENTFFFKKGWAFYCLEETMRIHTKLKKMLEPLKYWSIDQKKQFMPVVEYCERLKQKVDALENDLKKHQSPMLPYSVFADGSHISKSFQDPPPEPVETLEDWLRRQFDQGNVESDKFKSFLKRKQLTLAQAKQMAHAKDKP